MDDRPVVPTEITCSHHEPKMRRSLVANEVTMSAQLNKTSIYMTGQAQLLYALIEAQPTETMTQARLPLNFSLVLDKYEIKHSY